MISATFSFRPGRNPSGAIKDGALDGLRTAGELVLERSNRKVPIEEGTLERSGTVTDDGHGDVAVSYDTPYAVRQHEDMNLRHDEGRQAKFLETAMYESRKEILALVQAAIGKRM